MKPPKVAHTRLKFVMARVGILFSLTSRSLFRRQVAAQQFSSAQRSHTKSITVHESIPVYESEDLGLTCVI